MWRVLISALILPTPLSAQDVMKCDWQARADGIVEPWEDHTRTYANGDVRLALLDTIEPAAGAFHILVLSPPYDELGSRQCRTIGLGEGAGFSGVGFENLDADYDPAVGLIFDVPVQYFNAASGGFSSGDLLFTLNQSSGAIETVLE